MAEIEDPQGLLKAYEKAKADLVELRSALKDLEKERDELAESAKTFEEQVNSFNSEKLSGKVLEVLKAQNVKNPESLIKYMDLSNVKEDDKGKLEGLDDVIKTVKEDFPERFVARRAAAGTKIDVHADTPVEKKPVTGTEAQVASLFSGR